MTASRKLPTGDDLVALLGRGLDTAEVKRALKTLGVDAKRIKDTRQSSLSFDVGKNALSITFYRFESGEWRGKLYLHALEYRKKTNGSGVLSLPRGLAFDDRKQDVHGKIGPPTEDNPRHRMEYWWDTEWAQVMAEYQRGKLIWLKVSYAPPKVQAKGRGSQLRSVGSKQEVIAALVHASLAAYRDVFFVSTKPSVEAVETTLIDGALSVSVGKTKIEGRLSALSLVSEDYWRRTHGLAPIKGVPVVGGAAVLVAGLDEFISCIRDEYTAAIHVLLDEGFRDEALLCTARIAPSGVHSDDAAMGEALTERFTEEELTAIDRSKRHDAVREAMFDGRRRASRRALLTSLVENASMETPIERRDVLEETIELMSDWEVNAPFVHGLLFDAVLREAISDSEPFVREMAREALDALAAKLVGDRAYEHALPVVELAIAHDINLPLQYARRWECRVALGDARGCAEDWEEFSKSFKRVMKVTGTPLESDRFYVWNEKKTLYVTNWRAYKCARLRNIVFYHMRRLRGQSPIGGYADSSKIKALKISHEEKRASLQRVRSAIEELNDCARDLAHDGNEVHRARMTSPHPVKGIALPTRPFLAAEGQDIDRYIRDFDGEMAGGTI